MTGEVFARSFDHLMQMVPTALEPKEGDIVRERKFAQPLRVERVLPPIRQAEVQPLKPNMTPEGPKKWVEFSELVPHKKEG